MKAIVSNCSFVGNKSYQSGGGLFVNGNTNVTIYGTNFNSNHANNYGGAVYCSSTTGYGSISFYSVIMDGNSGSDDSDQFYNDPRAECVTNCSEDSDIICFTYGQILPSLALVLSTIAILVVLDIIALVVLNIFCCVSLRKSISRYGYLNLNR